MSCIRTEKRLARLPAALVPRSERSGRRRRRTLVLLVAAAVIGTAFVLVGRGEPRTTAHSSTTCCSASAPSPALPIPGQILSNTNQDIISSNDPPGTIDGAKNPELIPDDVAYRVLLLAVAEPENPTKEQLARARAKISRARLSEEDTVVFLAAATQFKTQIDSLAAQAAEISNGIALVHPDSIQGRQLSQLGKQQDQTLVNTLGTLQTRLSAEGLQKLQAHVQSIKRNMKLYPPPPNMPAF